MDITEAWKPVSGYEGIYEVSDQGRVRSLDRAITAGNGPYMMRGRVLSIYEGDNYSKVRLKREGTGKTFNVHNLVAEAFIGPCPPGLQVCHNNGHAHDNTPDNLRYDTRRANNADKYKHGTAYRRRNKGECFRGHRYGEGSFYIDADSGKRVCLECERVRYKRRFAARHAAAGTTPRAELTECKYGHPLDGQSGRQRFCITCNREAQARYRARKRENDGVLERRQRA